MCACFSSAFLSRLKTVGCRVPVVTMVSKMGDVSGMRIPYRGSGDIFDVKHLASTNPFKQFESWFEEARVTKGIAEANAMALGTASKEGVPTVSMVLLKGYDDKGFKFFTNYESRKGRDLTENPRCAIMFYWEPLNRNIRIEGHAERLTETESADYFHSRPRPSQISVIISHQGSVISDREELYKQYVKVQQEHKDESKIIPKPGYWGGYRVIPRTFEFWQGQTNRLHDRIKFRKLKEGEEINTKITHRGDDDWVFERLSP